MMKQSHTKYIYFLFFHPLKVTGKLEIKSFRMSPWGQTRWGQKCHEAKLVHSMRPYLKHIKSGAHHTERATYHRCCMEVARSG